MQAIVGQPELLKEINRASVFESLKRHRLVSRPQVARETGLSRTTVDILMDEAIRVGLAREVGHGDSTGGRPPALLSYNADAALVLGAQILEYDWSIVATNLDGVVVDRLDAHVADTSPLAAVRVLSEGVRTITARLVGRQLLPAIGLGTPGLVDVRSGVIKSAVDLGWSEVPIRALVSEALGGWQVSVANRSKVGALAEHWFGAGQGLNDLIYVSIGTGVAAGIVHNGELFLGANSSAGELGHVTVLPDGPVCPCGNRGCLQELVSGPAIARRARTLLGEGTAAAQSRPTGHQGGFAAATDVLRAAETGDPLALQVVQETATYLGIAVANLINLFNPELIVLGGSVGRAAQVLIEPLRTEVHRRAMSYPLSTVTMVISGLGPDAAAIGAAALAVQRSLPLLFTSRAAS